MSEGPLWWGVWYCDRSIVELYWEILPWLSWWPRQTPPCMQRAWCLWGLPVISLLYCMAGNSHWTVAHQCLHCWNQREYIKFLFCTGWICLETVWVAAVELCALDVQLWDRNSIGTLPFCHVSWGVGLVYVCMLPFLIFVFAVVQWYTRLCQYVYQAFWHRN